MRKKILKSQAGLLLPTVMLAIAGFFISYTLLFILSIILRSNQSAAFKQERMAVQKLLMPLIDCQNTLNSTGLGIYSGSQSTISTYCSNDINTVSNYLILRNASDQDIAGPGTYASDVNAARIGKFLYQTGCVRVPADSSGNYKPCITVLQGIPNRNDALNSQPYTWKPVFDLPHCCSNSF